MKSLDSLDIQLKNSRIDKKIHKLYLLIYFFFLYEDELNMIIYILL